MVVLEEFVCLHELRRRKRRRGITIFL